MNNQITEELYLSEQFATREQLEAEVEFWDASTSGCIARCPRYGEHKIREDLTSKEEGVQMTAGNALHGALASYYVFGERDLAHHELERTWGHPLDFRLPPGHRYKHLHLGHLQVILNNYFDYASRRDTFKPILVSLDDLNLTNVVAAVWRLAPDGRVILGESKVAIRYVIDGKEFVYSGKPDLPVRSGGKVYVMDHKSTNAYLSDWYFEQHRFSNQLRGYCSMINELMDVDATGAIINGLYVGERAVMKEFKGSKFTRFGPLLFRKAHLEEAIRNQYAWRQALDYYEECGYYPQNAGTMCRSCDYSSICAASPAMRETVKKSEFVLANRVFLDL